MKVLVVDDDRTNRLVLRALLGKEGYTVVEAEDGQQAIDQYRAELPDLVLMDVMMPVMDGYESAREIKQLQGDHFTPVIFLTALNDEASLAKCVASGGDDFLTKPYSRVILRSKIDALERVRQLYETVRVQRDELTLHQRRMLREQEVAERVFARIVHPGCLDLPFIHHHISPMSVFNGDILLAARSPSGSVNVVVGDFTGHGLPAAVGAMPVAEAFYSMSEKGYLLADIVGELNRKLMQALPTDIFFAAAILGFDFDRGTLSFWNGGLPEGYLLDESGNIRWRLPSTHPPLGVLSAARLERRLDIIEVAAGERVVFFSDGVIEAHSPAGELFGEQRLEALFAESVDGEANAGVSIVNRVLGELETFRGGLPQRDDTTMIEVVMQSQVVSGPELEPKGFQKPKAGMSWSFKLELDAASLREFDPLPHIIQILMEIQGLFTHRERIYTVLAELFTNALDHGVLQLDSALKSSPEGFVDFYQQRSAKLAALSDGYIELELRHEHSDEGGQLTVTLQDSGGGFDIAKVDGSLVDNTTYCGRGIPLLRSLCSELKYEDRGSRAIAVYEWSID
jgi:CheY-like chemotaxis protein/anti-sigma regulatory factor (Ser/Thr protein kinase)